MSKIFLESTATLTGAVIGAGILSIPYVTAMAGFMLGASYIVLIGLAMLCVNLCLGEVTLRTKGDHQLTGYAGIYLGKAGRWLMLFSMVFGIYGALIAYIIGESKVLGQLFGISFFTAGLLFFIVVAALTYFGLEVLEQSELWMESLKLLIFLAIVLIIFSSGKFSAQNLSAVNWDGFFIPYGVVLFAFLGTAAIPEIREELKGRLGIMKRVLGYGTLLVMIVYFLFAFAVVGLNGSFTTEVATMGIGRQLGTAALIIANLFAALAMATAFVCFGYALKDMYKQDFGFSNFKAWLLMVGVPAIVLALGVRSFIKVLALTGAVSGGIAGVLVVLMYWKARKAGKAKPAFTFNLPKPLGVLLIIMFVLGALIELSSVLF